MMNHLEVLPLCKDRNTLYFVLIVLQRPLFVTSLCPNCFHLHLLPCCPSLLVHLLRIFLIILEQNMYWTVASLQNAWNYLSNEWSFIPIGLRTKELCPFYSVSASWPGLISERVTPKDLVVTPCTGLLKCWILMRWKENLMELLNIQFSSFVHLWTCA